MLTIVMKFVDYLSEIDNVFYSNSCFDIIDYNKKLKKIEWSIKRKIVNDFVENIFNVFEIVEKGLNSW